MGDWKYPTPVGFHKGKGSKDELQNYRFIHIKDWFPKIFESLVIYKMKPKLIKKTSIFQISKAGHRPAEDIFVL